MRHYLDFDPRCHCAPLPRIEQLLLKLRQLALARAHDVAGAFAAQGLDVLLAHHAAVQDPNPFGDSIFIFHCFNDLLDSRHVSAIAGEDFVGER